jgi:L-alanine-DL-glutamate epimerase-like enolase superfamily enzyme
LLESLRILCESSRDLDLADPVALQERLGRRFMPGWAQLVRAASLLDIAAWDLAAQRSGLPLHVHLGGDRAAVPLMAVAGYFADQRGDDELIAEALRFAAEGVGTVKLILGGEDRRRDLGLATRVREGMPGEVALAVDFHAPWRDPREAAAYCEPLAALGVRFIEDPFPGREWHSFNDLAGLLSVPLAAGEDAVSLGALADLLDGVGFLRADATASGGLTTARAAGALAADRGVELVPHVFPHVHAPLCAAHPGAGNAEYIDAAVGADPIDRLLAEQYPIRDGQWRLGERPGLDLPLDWDAVRGHAVGSFALEGE